MTTTRSATAALVIATFALAGCGDDDPDDDSAAFCDAIERSEEVNPFGVTPSGDREPDLDLYLAGLEGMSAAYEDALAVVPGEIEDDFETYASWAIDRYDTALAIEEPTGQQVDVVIFQLPEADGPSEELLAFIDAECGIDFSD